MTAESARDLSAENGRLRARVAELEAEVARCKRSGEALNTECEQIGEKADEAWRALNPYIAQVELLTAALTEIADGGCDWTSRGNFSCRDEYADHGSSWWCGACTARAALEQVSA